MTISNNLMAIITAVTTVLSIVIAYVTEHHDSNSKYVELIKATVQQQLDLKDSQYKELKKKYEEKINSLSEEIQSLKQENRRLKNKIDMLIKREHK